MIIALHGDFATPDMLMRDMGDLSPMVDCVFDGKGWLRFQAQYERLLRFVTAQRESPILIGYSRGGSVIAKLSGEIEIAAAVLYESPIIDSDCVGGDFPCLMIWNDKGAKSGRRRDEAEQSEATWKASHPVTMLQGRGGHVKRRPVGHCWDTSLNQSIRNWLENVG